MIKRFKHRINDALSRVLPRQGPLVYLYSASMISIGLAMLTNLAWGRWVSGSDFNVIQLTIRYASLISFLALPGMNEAASLAAGKGDVRTALIGLGMRFALYTSLVLASLVVVLAIQRDIYPGLRKFQCLNLLWYAPAVLIPSLAMGVTLALNRAAWSALLRVLNATAPCLLLAGMFLAGKKEGVAFPYVVGLGIANILLLVMVLLIKRSGPVQEDRSLIKYGMQTSVIRWPEFALSFEAPLLAAALSPAHLTIYFLAERVGEHIKGLLSNNFAEAFARYSRCATPEEIVRESDKDFRGWIKKLPFYSLFLLLIIPLGMVLWRSSYWGAIPLCMGLSLTVFVAVPFSFIRYDLIARRKRLYQMAHSTLLPVFYLPALYILTARFGLWGVFWGKAFSVAVGIGIIYYFGRWESDVKTRFENFISLKFLKVKGIGL